jgi:phospholipid/cholesterol/gamma-HCH transport system substrate-binding protein
LKERLKNSKNQKTRNWNRFLNIDINFTTVETKDVSQQIKLGAFVLGGVALFLAAVFLIGSENNIFSSTFNVMATFKNVEGLKRGDNVWLSGVKVGTVRDVTIAAEGKVLVTLTLKDRQTQFIRKDATASIGSDGLVGNKIVVLRPGTAPIAIQENDTINTSSPADTQDILNIAKDVGENTRSLTSDLSLIAKKVNEGRGVVGELLNDGALGKEIRQAVANLSQTGANTAMASQELHKLVYELRNGNGLMPTLLHDTAYAQTFRQTLANLQEVSANAQVMSQNLQTLATKFNEEDNAVGVLLSDKATADRLKNTIENAEHATEKLDENMQALQHNFLLRGYFRKQERRKAKEAASSNASSKVDD